METMSTKTKTRKRGSVNGVRAITSRPRFTQWLYFARDRKDDVGALARFAFADRKPGEPCWPMQASSLSHFIIHLKEKHKGQDGVPTELALRDAFAEFRRFIDSGGKMPARQGGIEKSDNPRTHRGYVILPQTVEQIRELAVARETTQGGVIEALAAEAYAKLHHRR